MFQVILYEDYTKNKATSKIIHEPMNFGEKFLEGILLEEVNAIPSLDFLLPMDNVAYGAIREYINYVEVYDVARGGAKVFDGRIVEQSLDMSSSGEHAQFVSCEGMMGYLRDSTQEYRPTKLTGLRKYMQILLDTHNKQVEPHKRIHLGEVIPKKGDDNVYRSIGYASTADTIKDKIIDRLGGYLVLTESNGLLYLNYYHEYGIHQDTPIQLATNLSSAGKTVYLGDLASVIVPLGEEIPRDSDESTEKLENDFSKERYTVKSVNNGSVEIKDDALIKLIGRRRKEVIFPNARVPSAILSQGKSYLANQRVALISWKVEVLDISLQDDSYSPYNLHDYYPIDNPYISATREMLQIVSKQTDIINPMMLTLDVGNKAQTLSQYQNENNSQINQLLSTKERIMLLEDDITNVTSYGEALSEEVSKNNQQLVLVKEDNVRIGGELVSISSEQDALSRENEELKISMLALEKRMQELENNNNNGSNK